MPAKIIILVLLLSCCGCALPAALEGPSLALSVASLGQSAYSGYDSLSGSGAAQVAEMPLQYRNNRERMLAEMWEAGYYLVRALHWEEEEMSGGEQQSELAQQARLCNATFVLVGKEFKRRNFKREEYAVYITAAGELATPPPLLHAGGRGAVAEPYSVELRESVVSYDIFAYSAYFFVPDTRPDGIMAVEGPWDGPCRGTRSYGAQIVALRKASPAQSAGLRPGDIIATVNGRPADPVNLSALFADGVNEVRFCRDEQIYARQVYWP